MNREDLKRFLGDKVKYEPHSQMIFGYNEKVGDQMILDVRGWGAFQNISKDKEGVIDFDKALKLQDKFGQFVADTINDKLNSLTYQEENKKRIYCEVCGALFGSKRDLHIHVFHKHK